MSEHTAYIGTYPDARKFAFCRCGWTGRSQRTTLEALHDREEHLAEAAVQGAERGEEGGD